MAQVGERRRIDVILLSIQPNTTEAPAMGQSIHSIPLIPLRLLRSHHGGEEMDRHRRIT